MKRQQWTLALSAVTLMLASCGDSTPTSQAPTTEPTAAAPQVSMPKPLVPPRTVTRTTPIAGLIQPTNSAERAAQVDKGRVDPFSTIVAGPIIVTGANPAVRPVPSLPPVPVKLYPPQLPVVSASLPTLAPAVATVPAPPMSPTQLAQAIAITGVVQVGNRLTAIVQVPNEVSSRYASVGDYLGNGKVVVKRIEMKVNEPVVVLEESGLEVIKAVGNPLAATL